MPFPTTASPLGPPPAAGPGSAIQGPPVPPPLPRPGDGQAATVSAHGAIPVQRAAAGPVPAPAPSASFGLPPAALAPFGLPPAGPAPFAEVPNAPVRTAPAPVGGTVQGPGPAPLASGAMPVRLRAARQTTATATPVQRMPKLTKETPATPVTQSPPVSGLPAFPSQSRQAAPPAAAPTGQRQEAGNTSNARRKAAEDGRKSTKAAMSRKTTGEFDARHLTDGQVDELLHRLVGPLTRMLRTEFRLDRERVGKLRDPRR
ncbi:hypothetical protein [Streptomyces sp. DW26H14]|uniref:hypothetical protein n=1 Tax=Streptomyces sp. DW26H14 TaxID=3435395 RepID=UPI00403DD118